MRINKLEIRNFKAIRELCLADLSDVILIAGPNGCGKSCILDAIRLLKSLNGSYRQQNEWHHFFSEFQLNINNPNEVRRLFTNPLEPVIINADFELTAVEREYIRDHAKRKIYDGLLQQRLSSRTPAAIQGAFADLELQAGQIAEPILNALDHEVFHAGISLYPDLKIDVLPSPVLQFAFGIYDPKNIGMIEYHSPNRAYQRERIGGINVNIEETSERMAQHAFYNWQGKYNNVKSELAAAFVRDCLIVKAKSTVAEVPSIIKTLKELFDTFLPGKRFDGPRPGVLGELTFPVFIAGGVEHDIDDLSSGEKELVYGYLRIRNVSPSRSIILLDEPELHLNPRMVAGLPSFYRQHLGLELMNQLWMVTHSDAFLRDAFRAGGFSIFHMSPASVAPDGGNQAVAISANDQVNRAIIDLVGDIAGYRPGSKVVIFESSESASFDASMTGRLFPDFAAKINALSGDDKFGVKQLYAALEKAVRKIDLPFQVYAIVDRDSDTLDNASQSTRVLTWDVYHIENFLLEPSFIRKVLKDNLYFGSDMTEDAILASLKECARHTLPKLVAHRLRVHIDKHLKECLDLGCDPSIADPAAGFSEAVLRVRDRVSRKTDSDLGQDELNRLKFGIAQSELCVGFSRNRRAS
jgi:predicted ATPase